MIRGENKLTLLALIGAIASVAFLMLTKVDLGIAGEWTWPRHRLPLQPEGWIDRLIPVGIAGCLLLGVARLFEPDQLGMKAGWGKYVVLLVAGWIWLDCLQTTTPVLHRDLKPSWVVYDSSISGYFDKAVWEIDDHREFLQQYESVMAQGDVLHVGTHPPGMFLLCRLAIHVCESYPQVADFVAYTQSEESVDAFRSLERQVVDLKPRRLTNNEVRALRLVQLFVQACALLTVIPLAWVATSICGPIAAWRVACLMMTFPAIAIFFPKSDVIFPLTATSALVFGWKAMTAERIRIRLLCGVLSGFCLWCGMLLSLAHLPVGVALLACGVIRLMRHRRLFLVRDSIAGVLIAVTIVGLTFTWNTLTDCNLWSVWAWNLKNHSEFYSQFSRTGWKWMLVNPLELTFAAGIPIALLAAAGFSMSLRLPEDEMLEKRRGVILSWSLAIVLALLWLSGKNSGEAARLWCFLLPWLLIAALPAAEVIRPNTTIRLLALQVIVCAATVMTVSGFESITEAPEPTPAREQASIGNRDSGSRLAADEFRLTGVR